MSPRTGVVPGVSDRERAIAIAGCLAELGAQRLVITTHHHDQVVHARTTNLPALLLDALRRHDVVMVHADTLGVTFSLHAASATWTAATDAAGEELGRTLHGAGAG